MCCSQTPLAVVASLSPSEKVTGLFNIPKSMWFKLLIITYSYSYSYCYCFSVNLLHFSVKEWTSVNISRSYTWLLLQKQLTLSIVQAPYKLCNQLSHGAVQMTRLWDNKFQWLSKNNHVAVFQSLRASICESGLGSRNPVRPSVHPSVRLSHKSKWRTADVLYHTKGQSLCYSDTKSGWSATPLSLWNLRSKWPTPFEKRRLRPISPHNVSTVGDSEKSSITTNIKSPRAFQRAIDGVRTLP